MNCVFWLYKNANALIFSAEIIVMDRHGICSEVEYGRWLVWVRAVRAMACVLADAVGIALAFVLASLIVRYFSPYAIGHSWGWEFSPEALLRGMWVAGMTVMLVAWFSHKGHYTHRLPVWTVIRQVGEACLLAMLAEGFVEFSLKQEFSRLWVVSTWGLAVPAIMAARSVSDRVLRAVGWWTVPVLVVGSDAQIALAHAVIAAERGLGYDIAASAPFTLSGTDYQNICRQHRVELVILAADRADLVQHEDFLSCLIRGRLPFICLQNLAGLPVDALEVYHLIGQDVVLLVQRSGLNLFGRALKTGFDRLAAALILVALMPLMLALAGLIRLSGGPAFYGHGRIGGDGRKFRCWKFRTMERDAETRLALVLAQDQAAAAEWKTTQKLRTDPRVTALGRFMRAYSLDELPQVINVLKGEMSLVGPRPISPEEYDLLGGQVPAYQGVKPGMTGLWQVSGRGDLTHAERFRLNSWYVRNWSLWLDVIILLKTVPVVVRRRGAY